MSIQNPQNSRITILLLLLISFFILLFFTKGYFSEMFALMDENNLKTSEYTTKLQELDFLSKKAKELKESEGKNDTEIGKYLHPLSEDEIIKELYGFTDSYSQHGKMKILSMTLTPGEKNELGFNEAKITLSVRVANRLVMMDLLNYVLHESNYKFFITQFQLPDDTDGFFNVTLPLTFFYKEM